MAELIVVILIGFFGLMAIGLGTFKLVHTLYTKYQKYKRNKKRDSR